MQMPHKWHTYRKGNSCPNQLAVLGGFEGPVPGLQSAAMVLPHRVCPATARNGSPKGASDTCTAALCHGGQEPTADDRGRAAAFPCNGNKHMSAAVVHPPHGRALQHS
mmetsp:Transcript_6300/g.14930  ORF Transcript_6300/g.14930 Transcript_6300/m.14930 type:complete len:108 (+) Transcript_6300:229-552(+)